MRLTLYSRGYCHLCEDMLVELQPLCGELGFAVDVVDVDADPALVARFDELVPVLALGEKIICHYFLDEAKVREVLGCIR